MKKFIFLASLAIIATLSFYACQKDSVLLNATDQLNQEMLDGKPIEVVANTDGSVDDRATCNLYLKVAFRTTPTYSNSTVACNREFRIMQDNAGTITQVFPAPGTWHLTGTSTSTGSNITLPVSVTSSNKYFVEFKKVVDPLGTTPYIYVFMSDNIMVQVDPLTHADVSWSTTGPINLGGAPYVQSSKANMSSSCVVTP